MAEWKFRITERKMLSGSLLPVVALLLEERGYTAETEEQARFLVAAV
jgi:hypothetical protein